MKNLITGQIVHFVNGEGKHLAAVVQDVTDKEAGICDLSVFTHDTRAPVDLIYEVPYSEKPKEETWHFIERA